MIQEKIVTYSCKPLTSLILNTPMSSYKILLLFGLIMAIIYFKCLKQCMIVEENMYSKFGILALLRVMLFGYTYSVICAVLKIICDTSTFQNDMQYLIVKHVLTEKTKYCHI